MAISNSQVSRVTGVDVIFKDFNLGQARFLPQRVAIIGQGSTASQASYGLEKTQVFTASEVGDKYGYGSPLHLACKQLLPTNNDGIGAIPVTIYPLKDDGTGVVADATISVVGTATGQAVGQLIIGGVKSAQFVIAKDDTATVIAGKIKTAIDSVVDLPVLSGTVAVGDLPITAKWKGESANDITIEIELSEGSGVTIGKTDFANGAVNPDVDPPLLLIGDTWETFILNCLNYDDTDTLDKFSTYGEGRWNQTVKKPLMVATGVVDDFATRTAITSVRTTDRVNFLVPNIGSRELPFVIAARGLAKDIVPTANDKPATNYVGLLSGLEAGEVSEIESVRQASVLAGSSTNIIVGGVAQLNDTVTMYSTGEVPAYRYVVDIVKLQQVVYNMEIILETMKGKPLVPDETVTEDPDAVQPKDVIALFHSLADSLAKKSAIIVDPQFTKDNATAGINDQNPKRLDSKFPVKLSGNVEVNSNEILWGFYFGQGA